MGVYDLDVGGLRFHFDQSSRTPVFDMGSRRSLRRGRFARERLAMTKKFTLADCPTPYPPWLAGKTLPEIAFTIPLKPGEDLTGATVEMFLERPSGTLTKNAVLVENVVGKHIKFKITWAATDLVAGTGQLATFVLTTAASATELIARFLIDVLPNPDPAP